MVNSMGAYISSVRLWVEKHGYIYGTGIMRNELLGLNVGYLFHRKRRVHNNVWSYVGFVIGYSSYFDGLRYFGFSGAGA